MPWYHVGVTYEVTVWKLVEADSPQEAEREADCSLILPDEHHHCGDIRRVVVEDEDRHELIYSEIG